MNKNSVMMSNARLSKPKLRPNVRPTDLENLRSISLVKDGNRGDGTQGLNGTPVSKPPHQRGTEVTQASLNLLKTSSESVARLDIN